MAFGHRDGLWAMAHLQHMSCYISVQPVGNKNWQTVTFLKSIFGPLPKMMDRIQNYFCIRLPKMVYKTILSQQMAERLTFKY